MRRKGQSSRRGAAAIVLQRGGIILACAALLAGYAPLRAQAQVLDPVPKEKPKVEPEVGPQPDPNARRKTPTRRRPKSGPMPQRVSADGRKVRGGLQSTTGGRSVGSKRRRPARPAFKTDPNAKWVCDKQTVVHESIWRGRSTLTYEFFIKNEGTADLRIKARGG